MQYLNGIAQVRACLAMGLEVVVDQRAVFVRAGHLVNAERATATRVEMADIHPDPRHFEQHLGAGSGEKIAVVGGRHVGADRSEEHTSELQSLMRISYAVFCLKKNI